MNFDEIEIEITTNCNQGCYDCNHLCSLYQAPSKEEMEPEQLVKFFEECARYPEKAEWNTVAILGGEPTLHSRIFEIAEIVGEYAKKLGFIWGVVSNKATKKSIEIHREIQERFGAADGDGGTYPNQKYQPEFKPMNIAPIDLDSYYEKLDCGWDCGIAFNRYGIYPCSPSMAIDRALGLDIGLKSVNDVSKENLTEIHKQTCKYCGFLYTQELFEFKKKKHQEGRITPLVSPFWMDAFEDYRKKKPTLTLY